MEHDSPLDPFRQAAATRYNPSSRLRAHRIGLRYGWCRYVEISASLRRERCAQTEAFIEGVRSRCESRLREGTVSRSWVRRPAPHVPSHVPAGRRTEDRGSDAS